MKQLEFSGQGPVERKLHKERAQEICTGISSCLLLNMHSPMSPA